MSEGKATREAGIKKGVWFPSERKGVTGGFCTENEDLTQVLTGFFGTRVEEGRSGRRPLQ
jgi:hypothetical protein